MKKTLLFFLFSTLIEVNSLNKPLLKIGFNGYTSFKLTETETIYPYYLKDQVYISIKEKLSNSLTLKYKITTNFNNYNTYNIQIEKNKSYYLKNLLQTDIKINKYNKLSITHHPVYNYKNKENFFSMQNTINYKTGLKNFTISFLYSNYFKIKDKELFYHKINTTGYWYFPKQSFIKYKISITTFLQYGIYEKIEKPLLKSTSFTFETVLDFNKLDFETIFENTLKDTDNGFFDN